MIKLRHISRKSLFQKYKIKDIDLVSKGFFSSEDLNHFGNTDVSVPTITRMKRMLKYLPFTVKNLYFFKGFIVPTVFKAFQGKFILSKSGINTIFIKQYNLRASIVSSFKPNALLEIGTYLGWGASCFKFVAPECSVYTMNPKYDENSNNPIGKKDVGIIFKKKGLDVKQIWADSTKYN